MYCSLISIQVIKSRSTRWEGHVARLQDWRSAHWGLVGKLEGKRLLRRPKLDERIILKWIFF
jgi:hypothetical protein